MRGIANQNHAAAMHSGRAWRVLDMTDADDIETLPRPLAGNYEVARFNALQHGVLSQYRVLPWEDVEEYGALLEALVAEHKPQGPTEEHLVEEIQGIGAGANRVKCRRRQIAGRSRRQGSSSGFAWRVAKN
jgi:hypothetical protein